MKKLIFALIAGATAMAAAQAQENAPHAYVGAGIATADHEFALPGATGVDADGYKASGKVFAGYELNQTWGVEAGYTDFRKSHANYTLNGSTGRADADGHSFYLAGKASAPINDQFSVYGKLGAAYNKSSLTATDPSLNVEHSKTEAYGALGVQYNLNQQVALTAEYERYGKAKDFGAKADVWTLGAKYNF